MTGLWKLDGCSYSTYWRIELLIHFVYIDTLNHNHSILLLFQTNAPTFEDYSSKSLIERFLEMHSTRPGNFVSVSAPFDTSLPSRMFKRDAAIYPSGTPTSTNTVVRNSNQFPARVSQELKREGDDENETFSQQNLRWVLWAHIHEILLFRQNIPNHCWRGFYSSPRFD